MSQTADTASPLAPVQQALAARDRDLAAERLRALIQADPPLGDRWELAVRMAWPLGETGLAVAAEKRRLAVNPGDPARQLMYCETLATAGRVRDALDKAERINAPANLRLLQRHLVGTLRSQVGDTAGATAALREALALHRDSAPTWLTLAALKTFRPDDPDIAAMEQASSRLSFTADAEGRGAMLYALGKAYADAGRTAEAFAAYQAGAALIGPARGGYDAAAAAEFVDAVVQGWTADFAAGLAPSGVDSARPIFVLGLPRSGTTLVEQILSAHTGVVDGGEVNLFQRATPPLPGVTPDAVAAWQAGDGGDQAWGRIGRSYLHLLDERFGPRGRVVDKTLSHSRILGLIHHVLPEAPIVWLRRDPGDTAWSAFRTRFAAGLEWSWSLPDIARYFHDEDRLHAHWTALLGDAVLTVPYEELTADPDSWIPRILAHCGLSDEPATRQFHKSKRPVLTSSVAQVRRPVSTDSIGGWRRYEQQLRPFTEAYAALSSGAPTAAG